MQRLCLRLLLAGAAEREGSLDEVEFEDSNLLDWLLNFFLSPSERVLVSLLTWQTFVSSKAAGRTHLQSKPTSQWQKLSSSK